MKKIIIITAFGLVSSVSIAQNVKTSTASNSKANTIEARAEEKTLQLDKLVALNATQKKQIMELNLSLERRAEIVAQSKDDNKAKMLEEIGANRTRMYYSILTEIQSQKLKQAQSKK